MYLLIQEKLFYFPVLLLLVISVVQDIHAGANGPVPVRVEPARRMIIAPMTWVPGTVIGKYDSRIAAEVEGRIETLGEVGDIIEKGDILAKLDDITLQMQLEEAEAAIMPVEARLQYLSRESARLEMLAEKNNAAKSRLDEIQSSRDEISGELIVRRKQLDQVRDKYRRCVIKAPFAGIITERFKAEGEWVDTGDEIIRLVNTDKLEIQARVTSNNINFIKTGDELDIRDENRITKGFVIALVPVGDNLSRLYEIRVRYGNPEWMSGHALEIAIPTGVPREVIAVPVDALVIRQNTTSVYRINSEDMAEMLVVETGISRDHMIEIKSGLQPGDRVVTRGNERLRPQQKVTILPGELTH